MTKAVHVRIEGRVQGVWYRGWTVQEATLRRLVGWVRNRAADGSVEAVFQGDEAAIATMVEACLSGPRLARVQNLESRDIDPDPQLADFRQRDTV